MFFNYCQHVAIEFDKKNNINLHIAADNNILLSMTTCKTRFFIDFFFSTNRLQTFLFSYFNEKIFLYHLDLFKFELGSVCRIISGNFFITFFVTFNIFHISHLFINILELTNKCLLMAPHQKKNNHFNSSQYCADIIWH